MSRNKCRCCGAHWKGKPAKQVGALGKWADGPPATAKQQAATLDNLAQQAAAAGGSDGTMKALEEEAEAARAKAKDNRPIGARLDAARAAVAKSEKAVGFAAAAVATALEKQGVAEQNAANARAALKELEVEVADRDNEDKEQVPDCIVALLAALEKENFAKLSGGVREAMEAVHRSFTAETSSDADESQATPGGPEKDLNDEEAEPEDDILSDLEKMSDEDVEGLANIGLRLKRARRTSQLQESW